MAAFAVTGTAAAQTGGTLTDSSLHAGAKPVALTFKLPTELQCGNPRVPSATIHLPRGVAAPGPIVPTAVHVNGKDAASVKTAGRTIVVGIARPTGIQCDVISMGTLTVTLTKAAGLANPTAPGVYTFSITAGTDTAAPKLRIVS